MKGLGFTFLHYFVASLLYFYKRTRAHTQAPISQATLDQSSLVAQLAAGGYDLSKDLLGLFSCGDCWRMTNPLFKGLGARLKTSGAEEINCRCRGDARGFQANCRQSLIGDKSVCNVAKEMQLLTVLPPGGESSRGVLTSLLKRFQSVPANPSQSGRRTHTAQIIV